MSLGRKLEQRALGELYTALKKEKKLGKKELRAAAQERLGELIRTAHKVEQQHQKLFDKPKVPPNKGLIEAHPKDLRHALMSEPGLKRKTAKKVVEALWPEAGKT